MNAEIVKGRVCSGREVCDRGGEGVGEVLRCVHQWVRVGDGEGLYEM